MKILIKIILVMLIFMGSIEVTYGNGFPILLQPSNPGNDPGNGVPVDGGITALLVGGALYGVKKLKERKNPK
jgi:hypothetical protein